MKKLKICFCWQGISEQSVRDRWQDGLWYAMNKIAKKHKVTYAEPWDDIVGQDIILYWEAPCTMNGANGEHYKKVKNNPTKKALLFAGGPIKKEWVEGFDMLFLESKINEKECDELGIPWHHAFGINNQKFKPERGSSRRNRTYDGMLHGTCASWKRQWLIGEAVGSKGLLIGRGQDSDPYPFNRCRELGVEIIGNSSASFIRNKMLDCWTLINPCDFWGGGQRATLEAMAAGLPVICCNDSPKNMEFVEESGFGRVVEPSAHAIKQAVEDLKMNPPDKNIGKNYVAQKWSGDIYAKQIMEGINKILQ